MHIPIHLLLAQMPVEPESLFSDFSSQQRFTLCLAGLGLIFLLVLILGLVIAFIFESLKGKQIEVDLKRDMLDRGMTPDEIQKVMQATPHSGFEKSCDSTKKEKSGDLQSA